MIGTILLVFFSLLLFTLVLIVGVDLFHHYKEIYNRIGIGRWQNPEEWLQAIQNTSRKWFENTPTVKLTDNSRYVLLDIVKGKYKSSTIQSWQEAGLFLGACYAIDHAQEKEVNQKAVDRFLSKKINRTTGEWNTVPEQLDGAILAYALMKSTSATIELKPAFDQILEVINTNKDEDGLIAYRSFIPTIRFVDTIGFICPFLTKYGLTFDRPELIDLALNQIKDYTENSFAKDRFLPAHAYDAKENFPLGVYGWGRGLGWYILGIVDMRTELPENHVYRPYLEECIIRSAEEALTLQMKDGGYKAMLVVANSRYDSSATSIVGWLLFNAYQITGDNKYREASHKCITRLMKATRKDGSIDFCQGDTKGIGMYADTFDIMPFVQGLTVRLAVAHKTLN